MNSQETVLSGLLGLTASPSHRVVEVAGKGRGVLLCEAVKRGAYVVEYEAVVYPRKEREEREREYAANEEGCMIIDVQTPHGWLCFDATRLYASPGRLMNHARAPDATVAPFKPLLVGGQWRLGFVATRDLAPGDELTWDYGCEPGGIEWLKRRRKTTAAGEQN